MIRINLLPPEIIERRKWERFYPYVFLAAGLLIAVVIAVWMFMQVGVSQRNGVLQQTKTDTAQLKAQAEAFAIFERKQQELEARQLIADTALAGRVDMGRLAEDVSLVLPDEVFVTSIQADEDEGFDIAAQTALSSRRSLKQGYKSVAATLVRLASVEQLFSVWLGAANVGSYRYFQEPNASTDASGPAMSFVVDAKVRPSQPATGTE